MWVLTSRVFFVAHLKVNSSVQLSRDQSIGHNHDQPWDGKQHQQEENVPKETSSKIIIHIEEYVIIPKRPDVTMVCLNFTLSSHQICDEVPLVCLQSA